MQDRKYLAYLHFLGFSQSDFCKLIERGDFDPKFIYENLEESYLSWLELSFEKIQNILKRKTTFRSTRIDDILAKRSVRIIVQWDADYPKSLYSIPHAPYLLYVRWTLSQENMFAVVGSRTMSSYGKSVIEKCIPDLVWVFTIVSWWALWCDSEAHRVTLNHQWKTVCVIGTGIDIDYPSKHARLFDEIIDKNGAIISIFPIGESAFPYNFPIRNEIVVWLSSGVLVVEAKERSGTLITAWLCLDLWRDLFAVPGDIFKNSHQGTNKLIQNGEAKCVLSSCDILEEYDILLKKSAHQDQLPLLSEHESMLYHALLDQEASIDTLFEKLKIPLQTITLTLSLLELKWLVKKQISGKYIVK